MNRPLVWALLAAIGIGLIVGAQLIWPPQPEDILDFEGPRLAALIALLVVLGGSMLASRPKMGEVFKAVVFWGGLALVLVGLYAFRYDLEMIGRRTMAALVPGMVAETSDGSGAVSVMRANDGHFHVDADVDGESISFLVDTGASSIVLTQRDAERAGIDVNTLHYSIPVSTANGRALVAPVRLDRISVGSRIGLSNAEAFVAAPGALQTSLLGMDFLNAASSSEIRGDRLILRP
ncbi:retropepsin-like aspartic protease family protein [Rhodobium gokarnense]|uniref:Aspartyl protease family protein n=1 Tax=Rhodobium gokarnense TaxID=364296 RepID=A0ABT3HB48_9HYPH|nr:TIGR02281 family clan AA aspartic protease [Rhodobium gokarnense]MCW2307629.1 aspartyl protease family protein [Rhodobium gokarnense]